MEYFFRHEADTVLGSLERRAQDTIQYYSYRRPQNIYDEIMFEESHNAWVIFRDALGGTDDGQSIRDQITLRLLEAKLDLAILSFRSDERFRYQHRVLLFKHILSTFDLAIDR